MEELNKEKPMGHEFTPLREWSWSPTCNLASGNTVCGPLFVFFISQISSKVLRTRVGIQQGHKSKIKLLQEIVCTLIVLTIVSPSF
jgi:hypothetical protein